MPYTVKRVDVRGFQRNRTISVAFRDDVNFLIGRNGTGKTTFVRLLHACLNLDIEELAQTPFDSVSVSFADSETGLTPVLKIDRAGLSALNHEISFRQSGNTSFQRYYVDGDDAIIRGRSSDHLYFSSFVNETDRRDAKPLSELRRMLRNKMQFSWLPLLRSRTAPRRNELYSSEYSEEPINRKIRELVGAITAYLSVLDSRVSEANKKFQQDVFLSYIENQGLFSIGPVKRMNLDEEKSHLLSMFKEMDYFVSDVTDKLSSFFDRAKETQGSIDPAAPTRTVNEVVNIVSTNALHKIVSAFQNYTKSKERTIFPQVQFLRLLNDLLYRKEAFFDEGNVLHVRQLPDSIGLAPPDKLELFDLSSGERQLLVILSETLLQQRRNYIFIADEPELSLHVEWQVKLVRTIREMNDRTQIIFATHSPDIVSIYQECVIDFEKV